MYIRQAYPNELYHHGIKGQKWGVRRFQNPDGSLTPEGKKRYSKSDGKMKGITEVAIYLAIVGVMNAPLAIGVAVGKAKKKGAEKFVTECDKERAEATTDKKTGLKVKSKELPEKEDVKRVNPQYGVDKYDVESTGATSNCVNCTMALEMRKRGYEVQAKIRTSGRDGFAEGKKYFNAKTVTVVKEPKYSKDDMDEYIRFYNKTEKLARRGVNKEIADKTIASIKQSQPVGARGQICVMWNRNSGHSMMYDVTTNGVRLLDGQTGKIFNEKEAKNLLMRTCTAEYQRFDNCKVNYKTIKEAVR